MTGERWRVGAGATSVKKSWNAKTGRRLEKECEKMQEYKKRVEELGESISHVMVRL